MAWEECLAYVKKNIGPTAQEVTQVNWSQVSPADLDNQFAGDKPFPLVCPGRHCDDNVNQSPAAHRFCNCQDLNGKPIPDCTPKAALTPSLATVCLNVASPNDSNPYGLHGRNCTKLGDSYYILNCYCCCSCYANGTLIAVPNGVKKIENFEVGDKVMAASIGDGGTGDLVWEPARVSFSFGTGDGLQQHMVYLHYGASGAMICTPDQLFLLKTGKIIRGDRLVPGRDQLVAPNGDAVELHEISLGVYQGGVHHIATKPGFKGDLQGHLLNSAGIVTGDFDLQIHATELKDQFFVDNHDQLPVVGSTAYRAAHPQLKKTDVATFDTGSKTKLAKPLQFFAHLDKRFDIPTGAAAYLTEPQSADIGGALLAASFDQVAQNDQKVNNLLATFSGHYKDIKFAHLMGHMEVNAFAYKQNGVSYVSLTNGLTRLEGMDVEGLAMILTHLINRLSMSPPAGENGWTSVGMSDYYSGGDIKAVYLTQAGTVFRNGEKQIEKVLFDNIASGNKAYKDDPYEPTTDKRLDALDAGFDMGFPPDGIGGPENGGLHVLGATVSAPQFSAASFVGRNISADDSQAVFGLLKDKGILGADGTLQASVIPKTDLSFLFPDETDPATQTYLIETVRSILINADHQVAVKFNLSLGTRPVHPADFEFTPAATVDAATKSDGDDTVLVKVQLDAGAYTVKVTDILSANGSSLSPDHSSADITVS